MGEKTRANPLYERLCKAIVGRSFYSVSRDEAPYKIKRVINRRREEGFEVEVEWYFSGGCKEVILLREMKDDKPVRDKELLEIETRERIT